MIARIRELIQYRELIKNLVVRDLKVRYKNSVLGVLWSLLNPLLMTLVFTLVFTVMLPNNQVEKYPVFFMCGFLPWSFLASSVVSATGAIVDNAHLIKKVYFPREILALTPMLAELVNFLLSMLVLFGLMLVFGVRLSPAIVMLPLIVLAEMMFIAGLSLFFSTANVFYRDTQHILEILMQAWFFLTPIFYQISILPENAHVLGMTINVQLWSRRLNPMASLIASYRDVLYRGNFTGADFFLRTLVTCLLVLVAGYLVFCRFSRVFGEEA
jgi:lipopolysaccharide transport system permease protein